MKFDYYIATPPAVANPVRNRIERAETDYPLFILPVAQYMLRITACVILDHVAGFPRAFWQKLEWEMLHEDTVKIA
ncbi:MAG: hypothetical protein ABI806_23060 [Candidatus Solibacter sp.]